MVAFISRSGPCSVQERKYVLLPSIISNRNGKTLNKRDNYDSDIPTGADGGARAGHHQFVQSLYPHIFSKMLLVTFI